MGNCINSNKIYQSNVVAPPIDFIQTTVDRTIYNSIKNINWINESELLKQSIVNFNNILYRYGKTVNTYINTQTIASLIIIEYFNQCLKKNQIFRGQLKIIINFLQLKYPIESLINHTSIIFLDNKSISFESNKGKKFMLDSMLILDMLMFLGRIPSYKLANDLVNTILNIFNEQMILTTPVKTYGKVISPNLYNSQTLSSPVIKTNTFTL